MADVLTSPPIPTSPARGLLSRVVHNGAWMLGGGLATRLLSLLRGIVLARLLAPDDFGLFGLANIVTGFAVTFGDIGMGTFLIYLNDGDEEHTNTAFWTNLAVALGAAGLVMGLAPLMSQFFNRSRLLPVLIVSAFTLGCQIASTIPTNLLRRRLRFRPIALTNVISSIVWFGSALLLGLWHFGVWSLAVSMLLATLFTVVSLHHAAGWIPRWQFSRQSLRKVAPFSGWYLGQAVAWYVALNVDNIMVGKALGTAALGLYALAYNYASFPITLVANTLGNVGIPELAKLREEPRKYWNSFHEVSRLLIGGVAPIGCALIVMAPDLFPVVLGAKWNSAIIPFQILTVYMIIRSLWCDPFSGLGRYDLMLWVALANLVIVTPAIYLFMHRGISGVAAAVLIFEGGIQVGTLYAVPVLRERFVRCLHTASAPVLAAAGPAMLAWLIRRAQPGLWSVGNQRVFWIGFDFLVVFGLYLVLERHYVSEIIQNLKTMLHRRGFAEPAPGNA